MRREFVLPEQDADFLESFGYNWETINDTGARWLIIHDYPVPEGYVNAVNIALTKVNLALMIAPGYPVAQIDMVYFEQELRIPNKNIGAIAWQPILGKNWQRWSRHRTGENPWRPGVDDISTHLQMVTYWMERELKK